MAKIVYANQALADLERIGDFLSATGSPAQLVKILDLVSEAIGILALHPMIGRQVDIGVRELVISQGSTGYVALYSYEADADTVLVLAIRHQREAGFGTRSP